MDRRRFLKGSVMAAAALGAPFSSAARTVGTRQGEAYRQNEQATPSGDGAAIDTNVHLLCYPFRDFKYGATQVLVDKLRRHNIRQAWAGSYSSLFHKNIDYVNASLTKECRKKGDGMLLPFGTVNPMFPDWEEDLRRCHEEYKMPGIRLYPGYHGYSLEQEPFTCLLRAATERNLLVQLVIAMEDERMQHPLVEVPNVDVSPLPEVLSGIPEARLQLVHPFRHVRGERLQLMVEETEVLFEISNLDGLGALGRIIEGDHWYMRDISIPSERLLFGSHFPYFPLENSLFKFMESRLSEKQARTIMSKNAENLLSVI